MSRVTRWSGVLGTFAAELTVSDGTVWFGPNAELPILVPYVGERTDLELVVQFTSNGYSDPGNAYDCPPEGEDNREMVEVSLGCPAGKFCLPREVQEEIFNNVAVVKAVEAIELDCSDDEPEYDPEE
jgi:hypothetical protein